MEVGDQVNYMPAEIHSLHMDCNKQYPWVYGWMRSPYRPDDLKELSDAELEQAVLRIRRHPARVTESKRLVRLRVSRPWNAVVRAVNEDSTVDLDVESSNGGVTLHYKSVPIVDAVKAVPHSCHRRSDVPSASEAP